MTAVSRSRYRKRYGEVGNGGGDDVNEAAASPSKCNKRRNGQRALQIDKFNAGVYLYGNSAPLLLF